MILISTNVVIVDWLLYGQYFFVKKEV